MIKYVLLALALTLQIARADGPVIFSGANAKWLPSGLQSAGMCRLDSSGVMTSFADGLNGQYLAKRTTASAGIQWEFPASLVMGAVGASPNANGGTITGSTLALQPADATNPGVVTAGAQSFGGLKAFPDELKVDYIKTLSGATTILLPNFILRDNNGYNSVAWNSNTLTDSNNVLSVDWLNRTLKNTSAATTLNWETGALSGNASTATALAANPSDCASDTYATTIAASGNLTCASITNASTTATASAGNSTIVLRDGSGNFAAGTITAALTGTASGNTTYTPNQYGVVLSGAANAMSVLAPNASTSLPLISGGASANPSWSVLSIAGGGTGQTSQTNAFDALAPTTTTGDIIAYNGADNVRLAAGQQRQVLVRRTTASAGVQWEFAENVVQNLPISGGGTGQVTQTAAFNALSPNTSNGDIVIHDGTNNVRLPIGLNGQVLVARTTASPKVQWETSSGGGGSYTAPTSMLRLDTANGWGSTGTVIRRFTTTTTNTGSDWTYTDSSTVGMKVVINTTGTYGICYTDQFSASGTLGVSVNYQTTENPITTSVAGGAVVSAKILTTIRTQGANQDSTACWVGRLTATDEIRAHTDGSLSTGSDTAHVKFQMVRIN